MNTGLFRRLILKLFSSPFVFSKAIENVVNYSRLERGCVAMSVLPDTSDLREMARQLFLQRLEWYAELPNISGCSEGEKTALWTVFNLIRALIVWSQYLGENRSQAGKLVWLLEPFTVAIIVMEALGAQGDRREQYWQASLNVFRNVAVYLANAAASQVDQSWHLETIKVLSTPSEQREPRDMFSSLRNSMAAYLQSDIPGLAMARLLQGLFRSMDYDDQILQAWLNFIRTSIQAGE